MGYSHFPSIATPTMIISILFALIISLYYLLRKPKVSRRSPPEAGGAWPIVGHLPLLAGSQPVHITLGHMADKYGPIFTVRMGVYKTIVISGSEIAKERYTTNDRAFGNRAKAMALEVMGYNYAVFGFSNYGPYWRRLRKIATQELLSNHRVQMFSHVRESVVRSAIRDVHELWVKNNKGEVKLEMKKWFAEIALNMVFKIMVGKRFVGAGETGGTTSGGDDHEGDIGDQCRKAIEGFFKMLGAIVVSDGIPYLRWFDFGGYEKAMKKTAKELDQVLVEWLEEHKRKRSIDDQQRDLMSVMLSILDDDVTEEFSSYDADTIIKATCLSFILGGTDSSATTLTWALTLLLNNPLALKKAQQELDEQIGRERQVKESDIKNLVYLQAILKETLRLYPGFPFHQESAEDCILGGYYIPAGTRLLVNTSKLHRDPKVWSDPNEFRPERFLTTHQNLDLRGQNFEFIPFGSGRRICPGISFSLAIMQLTLAVLLHEFDIKTTSDQPVDMSIAPGITSLKALPLDVLLTPRLPNRVYQI
ncbi:Cytochrome P450, E-class, group I [Trema orientale]|uniref:Cytochrome P450, E-class, group I n=1 Tax=Trema orientale TaxID=63057 RepID=A0A2P5EA97_TREOI|nr:Cytochrome P450, E-class, group I [Trema orientale]